MSSADINPEVLKITGVNFQKADLNGELNFKNNEFDYCLCVEGLEHTFNPHNVIKELSRVLKPGGVLYLSTPNVCRLKNRMHYLFTGINDIIEPAPLPVEVPHNYGLHVVSVPFPLIDYLCRKHNLEIENIYCLRMHTKSRLISRLFLPILYYKIKKAYKKCRDKNVNYVVKRMISFMLSDEMLSGEGLIIKAKKVM